MITLIFEKNIIFTNVENKIVEILFNCEYPYGEITDEIFNKIIDIDGNLIINLICSLKKSIIMNNQLIRYSKIISKITEISNDYLNKNIIKISNEYGASPLNIMRMIFKHRGLSNKEISKLFKNPNKMNEYDKEQFELGLENDKYGFVNEMQIKDASIKFEENIEKILIEKGVKYKTEKQLHIEEKEKINSVKKNKELSNDEKTEKLNEQREQFITPDFVILSELYINNEKVNWIDAKNFYGANTNFIKKNIKKQSRKYVEQLGDGCIIFKYGFSSKLNFKNIVLVNL
jgi:hypothetical protein